MRWEGYERAGSPELTDSSTRLYVSGCFRRAEYPQVSACLEVVPDTMCAGQAIWAANGGFWNPDPAGAGQALTLPFFCPLARRRGIPFLW